MARQKTPSDAPDDSPAARPVGGGKKAFSVKEKHNPEALVEADDEAGAVEAYKALVGIVRSDHGFTVSEAT